VINSGVRRRLNRVYQELDNGWDSRQVSVVTRFSERELTFTFAICCRPSVVCSARAPYSAGWNVQECFFAIWYLATHWHFSKILRRSSQGNPSGGRAKRKGGSHLDLSKSISRKRCKIGGKLVLITNRKLHMSFRLVPKSVTLNDLERRNGRYFASFQWNR